MASSTRGTWIGFLITTFAIVGLTGLFATFAAPLPLERAMAREQALDDAQAAIHGPNAAQAIEALRRRLDESADALLPVGGDMDARIAHERTAMRARLQIEASAISQRLIWLVSVVTVMGAVFGVAVLRFSRT